jgi:hypothetical protein
MVNHQVIRVIMVVGLFGILRRFNSKKHEEAALWSPAEHTDSAGFLEI